MANKKQPELNVRIPEDLLRKLLYVSQAEGRAPNQHIIMLLRNNIQYFERAKGRIKPADLQQLDISEYVSDPNTSEADDGRQTEEL